MINLSRTGFFVSLVVALIGIMLLGVLIGTMVAKVTTAQPEIVNIEPTNGRPGAKVEAVITGAHLDAVEGVGFEGWDVKIKEGRTPRELPVEFTIPETAEAKNYPFWIISKAGDKVESPQGVVFTVEAAQPEIVNIEPSAARSGQEIEAIITGKNLRDTTTVLFYATEDPSMLLMGTEGTGAAFRITLNEATDEQLRITLEHIPHGSGPIISCNFRVTTPAGTAESPPEAFKIYTDN